MRGQKKAIAAAVLTLLVAVTSEAAGLSVGATVAPRTRLEVQAQPVVLEITNGDFERGYVEVAWAGELNVRVNHSAGFLVLASLEQGVVSGARIGVFQRVIEVAQGRGWLEMAGAGSTRDTATVRFDLSGDARPGVYEWPLRFAVVPMHRSLGAPLSCASCGPEHRSSK